MKKYKLYERYNKLPLETKIILIMTVTLIVFMSAFVITIKSRVSDTLEKRMMQDLEGKNKLIIDTVDAYNGGLAAVANDLHKGFSSYFSDSFYLVPDQYFITGGYKTPLMKMGDLVLNEHHDIPDKFTNITGVAATILVRYKDSYGDDFMRSGTSLLNEDGTRTAGIPLGEDHPGRIAMLQDNEYLGLAYMLGRYFSAKWSPRKDPQGNIIGGLFIGIEITPSMNELKEKIRSMKIGETGYIYAINAAEWSKAYGSFVMHPYLEGQNALEYKDVNGKEIIKEMIANKQGFLRYTRFNKELGDKNPTERLVVFDYYPQWKWIFVSEVSLDELYADSVTVGNMLIVGSIVLLSGLILLIIYIIRKTISKQKEFEKRLQQAQKMEAIGTLAGGIAHDFNNILGAIIGFTHLSVEDTPEESELRDNLEEVLQAGYRAKDLVSQILTFSRSKDLEVSPVQISLIIKEVIKLMRASLPSTICIQTNISAHSSMVQADPTQIHQILINLCTNAFHAMKDKGGTLVIELCDVTVCNNNIEEHSQLTPGDYVKLSVSDTGEGIKREIIDRIFDPYFTTKKAGEGTGLGLAVIHGIVNSLGGCIQVFTELNQGSQFIIHLPRISGEAAKQVIPLGISSLGNEKIMLVDDEKSIVRMGKKMLKKLGYTVAGVSSSMQALKLFKKDPWIYDLVITDLTMPDMTGDQLAEEILKIRPEIPIIIWTGYSDLLDMDRIKEIGVKEVLSKPVNISVLSESIRKVLDYANTCKLTL